MNRFGKVVSAVLSFIIAGTMAVPTAFAESDTDDILCTTYDSTIAEESKEEIENSPLIEPQGAPTNEVPFNVFDIVEAHKEYVISQSPEEPAKPSIYRKSKGIDVSQWQGTVDWKKVKSSGVDYAIIRSGYGRYASQKDPSFDTNMKAAKAAGLECGTYWYSYALSPEEAVQEAEACYQVIKNYKFTYPVYFDIEDPSQSKLSTAQISAIIDAFCSTLQAKGYYVGLYSYANFLTTRVFSSLLTKYDVWVAHFNVAAPDYSGNYGMWQYSSTGSVSGISGDVDLDYAYINYPYVISPDTYVDDGKSNGTEPELPPQSYAPEYKKLADGIDVSQWQNTIDWSKVKSSGVDYAIIRAGYGRYASQKDEKFDANMKGAQEAGIKCGAYWYSYASSVDDAILEAKACCEVIKGYKFEYPVYFDIEDPVFNSKTKSEITAITNAFCSYMESQGYYVGITSYTNFLNTRIDPIVYDSFDVWVAHYRVSKPDYYGNYGMWQYTDSARVSGISTDVDRDHCYYDYPNIMKEFHLNGF